MFIFLWVITVILGEIFEPSRALFTITVASLLYLSYNVEINKKKMKDQTIYNNGLKVSQQDIFHKISCYDVQFRGKCSGISRNFAVRNFVDPLDLKAVIPSILFPKK
jgi:hypothetical protein